MSDDINEKLSAYLDEELEVKDLNFLEAQLTTESELKDKLNRYALISEAIKGNENLYDASSVMGRVSKQIENEPTILAPSNLRKPKLPNWLKPVSGAAIAATVATIAVLNFNQFANNDPVTEQFPVTVDVSTVTSSPFMAGLPQRASTQWTTRENNQEIEEELNQLLIDHSEFTNQAGVPGLVPYATFVVYDK